jgi:hypothetical protein
MTGRPRFIKIQTLGATARILTLSFIMSRFLRAIMHVMEKTTARTEIKATTQSITLNETVPAEK